MKNFKFLTFVTIVCLLAVSSTTYAVWNPAPPNPPNNNTESPINVGTVDQLKVGGFASTEYVSAANLTDYVKMFISGGHPRITLSNDGTDWNIDNYTSGFFRIFKDGVVRLGISGTDGRLTINSGTPANGKILSSLNPGGLSDWRTLNEVCAANPAFCDQIGGASFWGGTLTGNINNLNSGNVGIGTLAPQSKLSVDGPIGIMGDRNDGNLLQFGEGLSDRSVTSTAGSPGSVFYQSGIPGLHELYIIGGKQSGGNIFADGVSRAVVKIYDLLFTPTLVTQQLCFGADASDLTNCFNVTNMGGNNSKWATSTNGTGIYNNNGGNVGIGAYPTGSNPTAKLQVLNGNLSVINANPRLTLSDTTGNWNIDNNAGTFRIFEDGLVRMAISGNSSPTPGNVDIKNTLQIRGGSPALGDVLQSDATGLATWVATSTLGIGGDSFWGGLLNGNINSLNTGNVGIGTITPGKKLDISTSVSSDGLRVKRTDNSVGVAVNMGNVNPWVDFVGGINFIPSSYGELGVWNGATKGADDDTLLKLDGVNKKIGINTNTPSVELDINGEIRIRGQQQPAAGDVLASFDTTGKAYWADPSTLGGGLWSKVGTTNNIYNTGLLNVGIGTNAPAGRLHIVGPATGNVDQIIESPAGAARLFLKSGATSWRIADTVSGMLSFIDDDLNISRLAIDSAGNVGINQGTPTAKLDVVGNIKITDGTQALGKVLQSDATGLATWVATSTLGIGSLPVGVLNDTMRYGATGWIKSSYLTNSDTGVAIGTGVQPISGTELRVVSGGNADQILESTVASNALFTIKNTVNAWGFLAQSTGNFLLRDATNNVTALSIQPGATPIVTIPNALIPILNVSNQIRLSGTNQTPGNGKILADNDGTGNAKWKLPSEIPGLGLPTGTNNQTLRYNASNNLVADSFLKNESNRVIVGNTVLSSSNMGTASLVVSDGGISTTKFRIADVNNFRATNRFLMGTDANGGIKWEAPILTAHFEKTATTYGSLFGLIDWIPQFNSDFNQSGSTLITYSTEEGVGGFLQSRDILVMSCPTGRIAMGGGATCGSGDNLSINGPYGNERSWAVSCGNTLGSIETASVSCVLADSAIVN